MAQQRMLSPTDRQSKRKTRPRATVTSPSDGAANDGTARFATLIQSHWRRKMAERDVNMIRMIYQDTRQRRRSAEDEWWLRTEPKTPRAVFQGLGKDVIASAKACSKVKKTVNSMQLAVVHSARVKRLKHRLGVVLALQRLRAECTARAAQRESVWRSLCAADGEGALVLDDVRIRECDAAAVKIQHAWAKHVLRCLSLKGTARGVPEARKSELQGRVKRLSRLSQHQKAADTSAARAEQAARKHVRRMSSAMRRSKMGSGFLGSARPPSNSTSPCSRMSSISISCSPRASPRASRAMSGSPRPSRAAVTPQHGSRAPFQETPPRLVLPVPVFSSSCASSSTPRPDGPHDASASARRPGQLVPTLTPRGGTSTLQLMPKLDPVPTVRTPDGEYLGGVPGCAPPMRMNTPRPTGDPCQPGKPRRIGNPVGANGPPAATPCRGRSLRRTMQATPSSTLAMVGGTLLGGAGQSTLQPLGSTPRQSTLAPPPPALVSPRAPPVLVSTSPGRPVDPTAKGANASVLRPFAMQRTPRRS